MVRVLGLSLCIAAGLAALPAAAGVVRSVAVTKYPSPASDITDAESTSILDGAGALLTRDDGKAADNDGDVACAVTLTATPKVAAFGDVVLDGIISNRADFEQVCKQPGLVHVVNQINWCGDGQGNLLGCADDRPCIVVVRSQGTFTRDLEPVLWAHEYGHTRKLKHSCDGNCTPKQDDRVMHPTIEKRHLKIGGAECAAFQR